MMNRKGVCTESPAWSGSKCVMMRFQSRCICIRRSWSPHTWKQRACSACSARGEPEINPCTPASMHNNTNTTSTPGMNPDMCVIFGRMCRPWMPTRTALHKSLLLVSLTNARDFPPLGQGSQSELARSMGRCGASRWATKR
jgi:hypothetical protein